MRLSRLSVVALVLPFASCAGPDATDWEPTAPPQRPVARRERPRADPPARVEAPPRVSTRPPHPAPRLEARRPRREQWSPASGRISPRWKNIVIHHSATNSGGAASFDRYHREVNGWEELGYHFVIGNGTQTPDGYVEVGSRWHKQKHGAHCKSPGNYYNTHGIGICLVGDFTRTGPSRAQMASLHRLLHYLRTEARIAPSAIVSHGEINHKTQCPGRYLPMASIRRALSSPAQASSFP